MRCVVGWGQGISSLSQELLTPPSAIASIDEPRSSAVTGCNRREMRVPAVVHRDMGDKNTRSFGRGDQSNGVADSVQDTGATCSRKQLVCQTVSTTYSYSNDLFALTN
ncbi:hypothetical protein KOR42_21680 [Thalassoglobus neptunius]|uniref:Uncharacterized protein n=2 Tax=Thalassoglobus neptunius TaxID=1938619 RepID=A0A5C5XA95_9PLAN|nr:hypothetical protein KOR42_21680 [Thalassoglobus neptunius]